MAVLIPGIIFLGIPHGALDIFILRKITKGRRTLIPLLITYALAVVPMIVLWVYLPDLAFLVFVIYSAAHFAHSDMSEPLQLTQWWNRSIVELSSRFLIPICIPFATHPDRSLQLIELLYSPHSISYLMWFSRWASVLAIASSVLFALQEALSTILKKSEWRVVSIEPLVLCALFATLDPLYAFGIYFSFIHAVKHLFNFFESGITVNFVEILPYWLIPVGSITVLVWFASSRSANVSVNLFHWTMIMISALALPHTALISWCKRRGLIRT
jgi:Brp/Blh family beta-carotene 15,15'-monooxygenase